MLSTGKSSFADFARRRRLSRWALVNAWKLSGLTALVTFFGFFLAIALSLLLRPTRSYFLPLLSDVDKYQPEGAILRLAFFISSALFFATTTASVLHYHTLCLLASSADRSVPSPHAHLHAHLHAHSSIDMTLDDADVSEIVPTNPALPTRRRYVRFSTTSTFLLLSLLALVAFSTLQNPGLSKRLTALLHRINFTRLLLNLSFYFVVIIWMVAMSFLIWYFLKLQNMPDCPPPTHPTTSSSSSGHHQMHEDTIAVEDGHIDDGDDRISPVDACSPAVRAHTLSSASPPSPSHRAKAVAAWFVVILRPVCLTGQAVCIIKIVGLWLALDTFSISNIRLVKIALLAALAFAEYMAALFFAFFMTILAVDMRAKAPSADMMLMLT